MLLIATMVLGPASAATAQTWPASTTAAAPRMAAAKPAERPSARATSLRISDLRRAASPRPLKLMPTIDAEEAPDVDLRARSEWSDDEGFRVTPTRVAFKRRF
jgi:hypothetical protein